jgi:CRP-like cAMP-binding protein
MTVDVNSEDGMIIRKLIPLATLPGSQFNALCAKMAVEETQDGFLFKKGDTNPQLVYLISGEVTLQAAGLVVEVIAANSDSAIFALAHQIPRKIDAVANGNVRFLRLDPDIVKNPPAPANKEDKSYMVIDETESDNDDWMTSLLKSPIFQRLPPANLQKILMSLELVHFQKGEIVLEQGGTGDYYYLIKQGQCLLTRRPSPNAKEIKLAQLGNGETFGEDALLSGAPRNVTITALTDLSLLRLDKNRFVSLIKEPSLKFVDYDGMQEAVKKGAILLDVSSPDDYENRHLDGSINAPFFSLRVQLKTLSLKQSVVVVCQDGKTSEAAAFILLKHKIDAVILRGGMEGIASRTEQSAPSLANKESAAKQPEAIAKPPPSTSTTTAALENQLNALTLENEALKNTNRQLADKCAELEAGKQNAEKQCQALQKQMDTLIQMLDKLKGG